MLKRRCLYFLLISTAYVFPIHSTNIDSLLSIESTTSDTLVADALYSNAKLYYSRDIDSSLILAVKSAALSERLNYTAGCINAYRGISAIAPRAGDNELALKYINKGIQLIEKQNLPQKEKLNFFINKGAFYLHQNKIGEAIETNTEAYQLALSLGLKEKTGLLLNNMGVLYRKVSEYDKAIESYKGSITLRESINDSLGVAKSLYNLGATYAKVDSSQNAFNVLQKAKSIFNELGKTKSIYDCELAIGTAAYDLGQFQIAYDILSKLEQNTDIEYYPIEELSLHLYLAKITLETKQYSEVERLLNEIKDIESSEFNEQKVEYYLLLSRLKNTQQKYKSALNYHQKFVVEQEKLTNAEKLKFREEMEAKFQNVQKDLEIDQLEMQEELISKKLKISRQRNIGLGVGVGLLGIFLWSLTRLNKKISIQNKHITRVNDTNKVLIKEIHHRVKNNLQVVSSLLNMQARKTVDENTKDALKSSKSRVQSMSILHQSLYQKDAPTKMDVKNYFTDIIENIQDTYEVDIPISIQKDIDSLILDVDTLVPLGLVLNELLTNAYKHAFQEMESGMIYISFKSHKEKDSFELSVKDNGIGLSKNELPLKTSSLGSKLIKEFTRRLDGKLKVDGLTNGTEITITFPNK